MLFIKKILYNKNLAYRKNIMSSSLIEILNFCDKKRDLDMVEMGSLALSNLQSIPIFCNKAKAEKVLAKNQLNEAKISIVGQYFVEKGGAMCKSDK